MIVCVGLSLLNVTLITAAMFYGLMLNRLHSAGLVLLLVLMAFVIGNGFAALTYYKISSPAPFRLKRFHAFFVIVTGLAVTAVSMFMGLDVPKISQLGNQLVVAGSIGLMAISTVSVVAISNMLVPPDK